MEWDLEEYNVGMKYTTKDCSLHTHMHGSITLYTVVMKCIAHKHCTHFFVFVIHDHEEYYDEDESSQEGA